MNEIASFGPWENLGEIGSGGQSHIYKASRVGLDGKTIYSAIRTMQVNPNDTPADKRVKDAAFAHEYSVLSKLRSIYIAPVLDFGLEPVPWMATKIIEGQNLAVYLDKNGPLGYEQWVRFSRQLIGGLQHAHKRKVVHQDIKPLNIMINKNNVAVWIDFSSASIIGIKDDGYQGGVSTVPYCAPERYGQTFSDKSDIFSLGVTLYEAATGRPVSWHKLGRIQTQEAFDEFVALVAKGESQFPNMNSKQRALVASMMSLNPANRPSASEVMISLNQMMSSDFEGKRPGAKGAVKANPNPAIASTPRQTSSTPKPVTQTGLGCLVIFTPIFGFLYLVGRELDKKQSPLNKRTIRVAGLWASTYAVAGFGGWFLNFIWYRKTKKLIFAISGIVQLAFSAFFYLMLTFKPNSDGFYLSLSVWGAIITSVISTLLYTADN